MLKNNCRTRLLLSAATALALVMGGCSSEPQRRGSRVKPASERKAAPDFTLKDSDGKTVQLSEYRGKVVLLNFWATWCGPCKIEIPWFIDFERRFKDQGFAVVGISMDEDGWKAVKPFITEASINYRVLLGDDSVAQLYGGVDALPTTFIIDREGKVAVVHSGLVSRSTYENDVKQLFDSPRGAAPADDTGLRAAVARAE